MAAPPRRKHTACAENTAQKASVLSAAATPTQRTKAAFVRGTAGRMGSALRLVARPRVLKDHASAPNTVRLGPAQCLGAPPTQELGKGCAGSIPPTKRPARLKAVATTQMYGALARNTTRRRRSALLQGAVQLLALVGSARNTAPMGSAPSAVAPTPPDRLQKERAPSTAVAARKCARRQAAPRLPKHAASAASTVRTERASLMAAPPTHAVMALYFAGNTAAPAETEQQQRPVLPCYCSCLAACINSNQPV